MLIDLLNSLLSNGVVLSVWAAMVILSLLALIRDLRTHNPQVMSLMKAVWFMTVLYSGPVGYWLYFISGRKQISNNSLWRKAVRSVAHCYSGCGAGELIGVLIAAGMLSLGNTAVAVITFVLAYIFGYGMTLGPLLQDGVPLKRALIDTFYSDTATIAVMELTAISLDLWLAANTGIGDLLFWGSLIFSLSVGLLAAYPVNVLLVYWGIKEGMGDPRDTSSAHSHA